MAPEKIVEPRNYYLNEQHELGRGIKEGGSVPRYAPIDWSARGKKISGSLRQVKREIEKSLDPLRDSHYFIVAKPGGQLRNSRRTRRRHLQASSRLLSNILTSPAHSPEYSIGLAWISSG